MEELLQAGNSWEATCLFCFYRYRRMNVQSSIKRRTYHIAIIRLRMLGIPSLIRALS
jgi:hypothetical protein